MGRGEKRSVRSPAEILAATRRELKSQGPKSVVEPLREWLERNPDAEQPSIGEAEQIVRELLAGANLSELPPASKDFLWHRWAWIREHFPRRAGEALRNWISASKRDPDYWDALKVLSARMLRGPLPVARCFTGMDYGDALRKSDQAKVQAGKTPGYKRQPQYVDRLRGLHASPLRYEWNAQQEGPKERVCMRRCGKLLMLLFYAIDL